MAEIQANLGQNRKRACECELDWDLLLANRRATSLCSNERVAGCISSGGPAFSRRFREDARSSFSIGRSVSISYPVCKLDGKTGVFSLKNIFRSIPSSRSRHLLSRELTVLEFNPRARLISS